MSKLFLSNKIEYDQDLLSKTFDDKSITIIKDFHSALSGVQDWSRIELENIFENMMEQNNVAIGKLMKPIRVALSGIPFGPGLFDLILLLGKDICLRRLKHTLSIVE